MVTSTPSLAPSDVMMLTCCWFMMEHLAMVREPWTRFQESHIQAVLEGGCVVSTVVHPGASISFLSIFFFSPPEELYRSYEITQWKNFEIRPLLFWSRWWYSEPSCSSAVCPFYA